MGLVLIAAMILGLFGLLGIFLFPWVGGPVLVIAVILGAIGLFVGPAAVAAAADEDVGINTEETPHLPGPGNPESGVE